VFIYYTIYKTNSFGVYQSKFQTNQLAIKNSKSIFVFSYIILHSYITYTLKCIKINISNITYYFDIKNNVHTSIFQKFQLLNGKVT